LTILIRRLDRPFVVHRVLREQVEVRRVVARATRVARHQGKDDRLVLSSFGKVRDSARAPLDLASDLTLTKSNLPTESSGGREKMSEHSLESDTDASASSKRRGVSNADDKPVPVAGAPQQGVANQRAKQRFIKCTDENFFFFGR
jgi:hypothetical protein